MLTAIVLSTVVASPRPAIFAKYPSYDIKTTDFAVAYQPGGRTVEQVWQQEVSKRPNQSVVAVFNGGYFAPNTKPIMAVDLVVSNGQQLVPYRLDLSRPIIAFGDGRVSIFTGKNGQAYAKWQKYRLAGGYEDVIAGDSKPQDPTKKRERRIVGLRGKELVDIRLISATWGTCKRVVAEQQLDIWLYLDGGTSVYKGVKVPTHVIALVPKDPDG